MCVQKGQWKCYHILRIYIDDILLIENDIFMLTSIKVWLSKEFIMKDLGEASYIFGIKIYRDRSDRKASCRERVCLYV